MAMSFTVNKNTKLADLIHYRLKVTTIDGRSYVGQLLAFDKHMNLVLADTEEARVTKKLYQELAKNKVDGQVKVNEDKRFLGLIVLRGEQVVGFTIQTGPTTEMKKRFNQLKQGKGVSRPLKTPVSQKPKLQGPTKKWGFGKMSW